jgi:short-subunit dehydrogenase
MVDTLYALMRLTRLVLPYMEKNGFGHILNVHSSASGLAVPDRAAYEATQAGILTFTRSLCREFSKRNISFTAFSCGPNRPVITSATAQLADKDPLAHLPSPEKTAAALVEAVKRRIPRVEVSSRPSTQSILDLMGRVFPEALDGVRGRRAYKVLRGENAGRGE